MDRFALELCVAACAGSPPPEWVLAALPGLPEGMAASSRRAHAVERAVVDLVEAAILAPRVGEEFQAVIVDVDGKGRGGVVQLADPPVIGRLNGRGLTLGEQVRVRLSRRRPEHAKDRVHAALKGSIPSPATPS